MIGKKVEFSFGAQTINGTILGQYRYWEEHDEQVPSGQGGYIVLPKKIGIDYYHIHGDDGKLYNIKCRFVIGLV